MPSKADEGEIRQDNLLPSDNTIYLGMTEFHTGYFPIDTDPEFLDSLAREGKRLILYEMEILQTVDANEYPVCPKCGEVFVQVKDEWHCCAKCRMNGGG